MEHPEFFNEMFAGVDELRQPYFGYGEWFKGEDGQRLKDKASQAESIFRTTGITFNVYGDEDAAERLIPFDLIPRILSGREWTRLVRGIEQRVLAINAFLDDVYNWREIIRGKRC